MQTRPEVLICRILGSDLPPRHREGQTLANINFIFDHEELVEGVARRWILNRIWDKGAQEQIVQVLSARQETYHCIPFDRAHYLQQRLDARGLPRKFNPLKILNSPPQKYTELLALEWIYRHKSLAAINLNAARNTALELFLGEASWVLPLDGNVFIRRDAQTELLDVIRRIPKAKYIILPMVRFADNAGVLNCRIERQQKDEPQIAFRSDSRDRFDERLRYGHRNKGELLARLGVPGPWHEWSPTPWEQDIAESARDKGEYVSGAWVARLNSSAAAEIEADSASRWRARLLSAANYCNLIDTSLADADRIAMRLHCYGDLVKRESQHRGILQAADGFLGLKPPSVIDKAVLPPSGDKHDYLTPAPYGQVDGVRLPEADDPRRSNRPHFQTFADQLVTLALAYEISGDRRYARQGALCARAWFLDPSTQMTPHTRYAQLRADGSLNFTGIVEFRDLWAVTDGLRILTAAEAISQAEHGEIQNWLRQFRDNWMWSKGGERAATAQNNIGVVNDLVIAAISAFLGDVPTSVWILNSAPLRLQSQIELYGTQPAELSRTRPLHYSLFSLQLWSNLAKLGRSTGIVDLWQCGGSDHRSLAWAIRFLALNREHLCDYVSDKVHFDQRIALLIHEVPQDGADWEVLPEWPTDVACDRLDHRDGISPLYAFMRMSSSKRNDAGNSVLSAAHGRFDVAGLGERRRSTAS